VASTASFSHSGRGVDPEAAVARQRRESINWSIGNSLIRVPPENHLQLLTICGVYASRQCLDAKTRKWIEFLCESIAQALSADGAAFGTASVKV
jgi:hypothetical protein